MKRFGTVVFVTVFSMLLFLVVSCEVQQVQTNSINSNKAMDVLRSADYEALALGQGDASWVSASAASTGPDLVVESISGFPALPLKIESGSSFNVITKIKNKGKNQAYSQSVVQYYLSANKAYSIDDIPLVGSRTVPIMEKNKYSKASSTVSVPSATPSGKYYLISCADDKKNVLEKNEKNNCKASAKKIEVTNNGVPISITVSDTPVQVTSGSSTDISISVNFSAPGNYTNVSLDLQDILTNSVTITPGLAGGNILKKFLDIFTPSAEAQSPVYMNMYARVGPSAGTVCYDGVRYGPFLIKGSASSPTIDPPSASAEPSTVNIINSGSFAMCIQIVSQTDASVNLSNNPSVEVTQCDQPPADISGTWKGTYTCKNYGWYNEVNQPITLTITQDGNRAQYIDDGGDTYDGTVCGNVFKFNRTSPVYNDTESGTLVFSKNGKKGTKTSTWISNSSPDTNWGTCTDKLHWVPKP